MGNARAGYFSFSGASTEDLKTTLRGLLALSQEAKGVPANAARNLTHTYGLTQTGNAMQDNATWVASRTAGHVVQGFCRLGGLAMPSLPKFSSVVRLIMV
jgi:hypothetical protein